MARPGGVNGEEQHAAGMVSLAAAKTRNGGEDRADAGVPTEGERETEEEAAPDAGLRGTAAEVDVAIEPAGHRRPEKADERERKK